ncbi:gag-pol polyprotein, partial [Trifolium medium]|nr:gag-pol polyprotein [Trifolium medium]
MEDTTFLSQSKYAKNMIKKFGLDNVGHKRTPAPTHLKLSKNEQGRILKYVNGTYDYGMLYTHGGGSFLLGYCDADWAGSADDRKNTSGGCFFLG